MVYMPYKTIQLPVGAVFGRLTTTSPTFLLPRSDGRRKSHVTARCECGTEKTYSVNNLSRQITRSCGCLHRDTVSEVMTTHGLSKGYKKDRLVRIHRQMKQRCYNPNARSFRWYGAKGVTVCEAWHDAATFIDWSLANGYADGLEIDRVDADGPYSPENCRWVTKKQNIRNRDMFWDNELDARLVAVAAARGVNPYALIREAVEQHLCANS